jgi:hypothetical protein
MVFRCALVLYGSVLLQRFPVEFHNCGTDLAEWLERLTANAGVATVLGSIPASSDTVESEGRQMKQW